jgi:Orsellinic acid/F9775 biosynthesis cluster protein D
MDEHLFFNHEFAIAICTACQSGVEGDVARHFARNHKETWSTHRKELREHIMEMNLSKKEDILNMYPEPDIVRGVLPGIAVEEGWRCKGIDCTHLSMNEKNMRRHCREVHSWKAEEAEEKMWFSCRLQSLFQRPHLRSGSLAFLFN